MAAPFTFKFAAVTVVGSRFDGNVMPNTPGWCNNGTAGSTDTDLINGTDNIAFYSNDTIEPVNNASLSFEFDQNTPIIDYGIGFVSFNDLPPGFTITKAVVRITGNNIDTPLYGTVQAILGGTLATYDSGVVTSYDSMNIDIAQGVNITPTQFLSVTLEFIFNSTPAQPMGNFHNASFALEIVDCEYIISNFQYNFILATPGPVGSGDKVTVTSDNGGLNGVEKIVLVYTDSGGTDRSITLPPGYIVYQTPNILIFQVPYNPPDAGGNPVTPELLGNDIIYDFIYPLSALVINFEDATGIYTIVPNKRNDTLYTTAHDGTTVDVAIPDPAVRLAFIP